MGYQDISDHSAPYSGEVDGLSFKVEAANTQKDKPLGDIRRVVVHWTAGDYSTAYDDYHYCAVYDAGRAMTHILKTLKIAQYGRHAFEANGHNIGFSFCAMEGATDNEADGSAGTHPITLEMLVAGAIFLAEFFAWHQLDPRSNALTDHHQVDIEIGRCQKWDIKPYFEKLKELVIAHHDDLKAGRATFAYKSILVD